MISVLFAAAVHISMFRPSALQQHRQGRLQTSWGQIRGAGPRPHPLQTTASTNALQIKRGKGLFTGFQVILGIFGPALGVNEVRILTEMVKHACVCTGKG